MSTLTRLSVSVLVVAGVGFGTWYATRPDPIAVVLAVVEAGRVDSTVANTRAGTVKACRRSHLAPATGGLVARLPIRKGDRVSAGQTLMSIWNVDLEARVALAQSELGAAKARMRESCLRADVAERDATRLQRLAAQNVISDEELDRSTSNAEALGAACEAMVEQLVVQVAQVRVAEAAVERTVLKAPFDGIVAEINAELGEFVTPSPTGIPTPPAVDLIDDTCLLIVAPIDEVDAPAIELGMSACVSLDAFADRICDAKVKRIAPYVLEQEKQARTVEVEIALAEGASLAGLRPGYSADVEIVLNRRDAVLRLPTEAVLEGGSVLVYDDGVLVDRKFTAGLSNWSFTEILDGLAAGERVVVSIDRAGVVAGAKAVPDVAGTPLPSRPSGAARAP